MKWIFTFIAVLACVFGIATGRMQAVSTSALSGVEQGVKLTITLGGAICFWSGVMNVAKEAGLTKKIAKLFSPILRRLFRNIKPGDSLIEAISMNVSANLLGLGNAATPMGIKAMLKMQANNPEKSKATHNMILFVVINTASLQIIPTTVATVRLSAGSNNPMEILLPMLCTSLCSLATVIVFAKIFARLFHDTSC